MIFLRVFFPVHIRKETVMEFFPNKYFLFFTTLLLLFPLFEKVLLCSDYYCKIPKISPGLYFSKALFEGLIFGGAFIWRGLSTEGNLRLKIDWASFIVGSKFTVFALFYFVFDGIFPIKITSPQGLIFGGEI